MKSELVSIVIPVYNSERYLEKCINSIISQSYKNIEIIAIDDGSTDSSLKILKKYSNEIKILTQKNNGLASSLNLGIDKMNGDWFKWFSPDDLMQNQTIEILLKEAKKYQNTIIYSNWNIIDENEITIREFHESDYNSLSNFDFNIRLLDGQQINVNTTLIPSSLLEKCRFRELDDLVAIDYDFFLSCALLHQTKFRLIPKQLINYRIHSNQMSHKNITKTLDYISQIKDNVLAQIDESLQKKYFNQLQLYQKTKSPKRKTMELGMKLISATPSWVSDRILTFYLNKIRQNR
ncbi:glycosyltransferase [Candidatus Nitrosopelagicus sp.]|nr:glycosyltransferase [Candidatus Nitrosopelagicus sp.]